LYFEWLIARIQAGITNKKAAHAKCASGPPAFFACSAYPAFTGCTVTTVCAIVIDTEAAAFAVIICLTML
jgi:hypothetical protein